MPAAAVRKPQTKYERDVPIPNPSKRRKNKKEM